MNFSAVKDLFKKFDILPKSVIVLVVSEKELIVDLAGLRKKVIDTSSDFELIIILLRFHKE